MITPVNQINEQGYYFSKRTASENKSVYNNELQLSNYKAGQAILARNNISFKNISLPQEVTDKYRIAKSSGKNHLEVPDVRIYSYPDTNLQLFINTYNNSENYKNNIIMSLNIYDTPGTAESYVKKELSTRMMCRLINLEEYNFVCTTLDYNFFNVNCETKSENFKDIELINNIVTSPQFRKQDLEIVKKEFIEDLIKNKQDDKELIQKTIKEIQDVSIDELNEYYKRKLQNSELRLFVSVDKDCFSKNKEQMLKSFNKTIKGKFKPHNDEKKAINETKNLNMNQIIYRDREDSDIFAEMQYFMPMDDLKSKKIAEYISLLTILYRSPYINADSFPLFYKSKSAANYSILHNKNPLPYLRFRIVPQGSEKMATEREAIDVYKKIPQSVVYEPLIKNTLEDIKEKDKNDIKQNLSEGVPYYKFSILKEYNYEIFKIFEQIDSITTDDITNTIEKYILNQEPVIYINEDRNPYKRKEIKNANNSTNIKNR